MTRTKFFSVKECVERIHKTLNKVTSDERLLISDGITPSEAFPSLFVYTTLQEFNKKMDIGVKHNVRYIPVTPAEVKQMLAKWEQEARQYQTDKWNEDHAMSIKLNKVFLNILNVAKEVIAKYDGKVMNARLTTAISKEATERGLYVATRNCPISCRASLIPTYSGSRTTELRFTFSHEYSINYRVWDIDLHTSERINAASANEAIDRTIADYTEYTKQLEEGGIGISEIVDRYTELQKALEECRNNAPSAVRSYLDLR